MLFAAVHSLAVLASAAPYTFPNATVTTTSAAPSGFVASLRPTAYPLTASIKTTVPAPITMTLKPHSTRSICPKPGNLICSMDGKKVGICGFAGLVEWMGVGEGKECLCRFGGGCTVVDV